MSPGRQPRSYTTSWFLQVMNALHSPQLLPSLAAGLVIGMITAFMQVSLAALIFSGTLSSHLAQGIGLMLFGAFVMGLVVALTSSCSGVLASPQDAPAAILGLVVVAIARSMSPSVSSEAAFATMLAAITLTSLLTGGFFFVLGQFKLGTLLRFVPYPVIGGFLAGTGWLITTGSIEVMTGGLLSMQQISTLFRPALLAHWFPGLLFAILLLVISRRYHHFLIMPVMLLVTLGLFYGILGLTGSSLTEARAQGWLLQLPANGAVWQPLTPTMLRQVQWQAIFGQINKIGTILIISVITLLLNASGLELVIHQDIDLNRELQVAGFANLVAGLGGSSVGYHSLSRATLAYRMGALTRLGGTLAAVFCGVLLFFGSSLLTLIPIVVLGGLLLYLGLALLVEWLYDAWSRLPIIDYALIVVILLTSAIAGFLPAFLIGVAIAIVVFVAGYTRINVVKHALSGLSYQSRVTRNRSQRRLLGDAGEQLYILQLQGFIFFGTAYSLLDQVRQRMGAPELPKLRFVVLDFRQVSGLDSTAMLAFTKMHQIAQSQQISLVLAHLSPEIQRQFIHSDFSQEQTAHVRMFSDLDHALESCENQILGGDTGVDEVQPTLQEQLEELVPASPQVARLLHYFERLEVAAGHYLIHQGDAPDAMYFIESGQVTALSEVAGRAPIRLETMRGGRVVGEIGFYLSDKRTASIVTDQPSIVYRLTVQKLRRMEEVDPGSASVLHQAVVRLLAERTVHLMSTIDALQR